jgi:hypothetical protein
MGETLTRRWPGMAPKGGCPRGRETIFHNLNEHIGLRMQRSFLSLKTSKKKQETNRQAPIIARL